VQALGGALVKALGLGQVVTRLASLAPPIHRDSGLVLGLGGHRTRRGHLAHLAVALGPSGGGLLEAGDFDIKPELHHRCGDGAVHGDAHT
jgi:hypothetical protein